MGTKRVLLIANDKHSITRTTKMGGWMSEEQAKSLINELRDVRSKTLRRLILKERVEAIGEVPEEYKDAVKALVTK